jgi:diphthine synthase
VVGLQIQKFGRTVSLPIPEGDGFPVSAYDYIIENKRLGLHTLILLENRPDGTFLPIPQALAALQEVSENRKDGMINQDTLAIGLARLECDDTIIKGGRLPDLGHLNFGGPPHSIIIPGRLHFKEAEALEVFAKTPRKLLEAYM